jgi:hypothetical protein
VSWIKKSEEEIRIKIRSLKVVHSDYRKNSVKVKYMLGFDETVAADIEYPIKDEYREPLDSKKRPSAKTKMVIKLNKHYRIWQWAQEGNTIENGKI